MIVAVEVLCHGKYNAKESIAEVCSHLVILHVDELVNRHGNYFYGLLHHLLRHVRALVSTNSGATVGYVGVVSRPHTELLIQAYGGVIFSRYGLLLAWLLWPQAQGDRPQIDAINRLEVVEFVAITGL